MKTPTTIALASALLPACVVPVSVGDLPSQDGSSDGTGSEPAGSGTSDPTDSSDDSSGTEGSPGVCSGPTGWQWIEHDPGDDVHTRFTALEAVEGGVIAVGRGDGVAHLRRYDHAGALQWERKLGDDLIPDDLSLAAGGELVVCGRGFATEPPLWLAGFDDEGLEQWRHTGALLHCHATGTTAAGTIVAGGEVPGEQPGQSTALHRFDAAGNVVGTWTSDALMTFGVQHLVTDGEEVVVLGEHPSNSGFWLGRLDAADQLVWGGDQFVVSVSRRGNDLARDPSSGDLVVVGLAEVDMDGVTDLALWRYSADGALQYEELHDFLGGPDQAYGVRIATDGSIVVVGTTGTSYEDLRPLVASFAPDGTPQWWDEADLTHVATDLALDDCGGIYVTGHGDGGDSSAAAWLGRYLPQAAGE